MRKFLFAVLMVMLVSFTITGFAYATQPLITDTAAVEGKGNVKVEVGAGYAYNDNNNGTTKVWVFPGTLTVGVLNSVDFSVNDNFVSVVDGVNGMTDITLGLKWQMLNSDNWMIAVKPVLTLPSGDENKGLSNGETTYGITGMVTKNFDTFGITANVGYYTVGNRIDATNDIFMASIAGELKLAEKWKAVGEFGVLDDSKFGTVGLIWSPCKYADVSLGARTSQNVDVTGLAGITMRF
jgi:hypothetical protein